MSLFESIYYSSVFLSLYFSLAFTVFLCNILFLYPEFFSLSLCSCLSFYFYFWKTHILDVCSLLLSWYLFVKDRNRGYTLLRVTYFPVKCGPGIDPETRTQATDRANHSATSVPILIFCFWRYLCKVFLQAQSQRIRATDLYTGGPNLYQPNTNLFLIFLSKHRPRCSSFSLSLSVSVYQSVNLLSVCLLCLTPRHWRKSLVKARDMTCHEHKDILRGLKLCE